MTLPPPRQWELDETTKGMLIDLDESAHQLNDLRPLSPDVLQSVKENLLSERVYSSNAIEGNTLTLRETTLVLQSAGALGRTRKREAQEALNLAAAYRMVEQFISRKDCITSSETFLEVHAVLMKGINDGIAGRLRSRDVMIRGAKHQPPDADSVSDLLDQFFHILSEDLGNEGDSRVHPILLATWAHWAIARIHPFEDGNGRMGRIWQDLVLLNRKLTVAIIRPEDRSTYYDALVRADDGNCNALAQLVCRRVLATMQTYLSAQEEADELKSWATDLVGAQSQRERERLRLEYERWRLRAEQVRDAFERCASLVSGVGDRSYEVQVQRYDLIDQLAWESLRAGGGAKKTWFFRVWFRHGQTVVWYIFFFGRHDWMPEDESPALKGPRIGLHISEQKPGDERAVSLDLIEDTPITLRELVIVDKTLLRRRYEQSAHFHGYDEVSATQAAKEFIEEVISRRLSR